MNKTCNDLVLHISNYLNVVETNHFYLSNKENNEILKKKNVKHKKMVFSWVGSLNSYNKLHPLRYFFINKPFDQFMFIAKTGVFDKQLTETDYGLNILQIACKTLDLQTFLKVYDLYTSKNIQLNNLFLLDTLKFRRPSAQKYQIKMFLEQKQMSIK